MTNHAPHSKDRLSPGTVVAGYRIEEPLGSGGMGIVYRATQLSLNRAVALKVLTPSLAFDSEARQRFLQEGVLAARVTHPQLVRVLQTGEYEHRLFLAFELVSGGTLREKLRECGPLSLALALEVTATCADVFVALHAAGVLHRDLKPENVFLSPDRGPLVADLGIAKDLARTGGPRTQKGLIIGTPAYIAPELVLGQQPSPLSDLYALGVLFFECLTGQVPFLGKDSQDTLRRHLKAPVPLVSVARPGLPEAYDKVMARLLAKDPAQRYPGAEMALAALRALPLAEGSTGKLANLDRTVGAEWQEAPGPSKVGRTLFTQRPSISKHQPQTPRAAQLGARLAAACALLAAFALAGAVAYWRLVPHAQDARVPAPLASRPVPDPAVLLREAADKAESQARVVLAGLREAGARAHRENGRDPKSIPPGAVLDRAYQQWKQAPPPVERAVNALGDALRAGSPDAAGRAGRLLADMFLMVDFQKILVWDNVTESAHALDRSALVLGSFGLDSAVARFLSLVSADAAALVKRLPPSLTDSKDPAWQTGLLCLRALSRFDLRGKALTQLSHDLEREASAALPGLDLSARAGLLELNRLSAILRAMIYLGMADHTLKMTAQLLESHPHLTQPGPLAPIEELLQHELVCGRAKLALRTNILDGERMEKLAVQMRAFTAFRDRLVRNWPHDPRLADKALDLALETAMTLRLEEVRLLALIPARRLDLDVAPEPAR
ncbi:MAG: serine/threonine protein kinase [Candidatus Wallbacteria bacterium]|nr:serine/threonine protein kinase [Candidatus Wallbacteria bacterium]